MPSAGGATAIPIARPAEGAPPSWIDHRVVVLTRERADGAGVTIVDPDGGNAVDGPGPVDGTGPTPPNAGWTGRIAGLALSADGSTVAVAAVGDSRIGIAPAGQWLARQPVALAAGPPATGADGGGSFAWLALSRDGSRLAVVRTDIDGDATGVTVHAGADDWQTEAADRVTGRGESGGGRLAAVIDSRAGSGGDGLPHAEDRNLRLLGQHHPEDLLEG